VVRPPHRWARHAVDVQPVRDGTVSVPVEVLREDPPNRLGRGLVDREDAKPVPLDGHGIYRGVATDTDRLAALLRDDVRCSMPPTPGLLAVPTSVNRQPAVAYYGWRGVGGAYLPLTIDVLRTTGGKITGIVTFDDGQFPRLGLPERLPADGTE
jgi:hypothetical protein